MTKLMGPLLLVATACGEVKDKPPGTITVGLESTTAFVREGGSVEVGITVERDRVVEPIEITVGGLPDGVTAGALTLHEGETAGTLLLTADATSVHGFANLTVSGAVELEEPITSDAPPLRLLVGGQPGELDRSFAGDGTFTPTLGGLAMACRGLAVTPLGIVVTGFVASSPVQAITARVLDDGTLDPAYGSGGFVSTGHGALAQGIALAALEDGSVIAAGIAGGAAGECEFGLFKYDSTGVLDVGFGLSGVAEFDGGAGCAEWHNVAITPDGSIIAGGTVFNGAMTTTRAAKFSAAGVRDPNYNVFMSNVVVQGSLLQPDGKLVLVGQEQGDFWIARFGTDSVFDGGFGGGSIRTDFGAGDNAHGVVLLPDGKLLVVGISAAAGAPVSQIAIARYNANGSLDVTFGDGGKVATGVSFESRSPTAVAVSGPHVYFAGRRASDDQPAVARITMADGTLDTTFGTAGIAAVDFGIAGTTSATGAFGVAVDAEGRVVLSGDVGAAGQQSMAIARLWF